MSKYMVLQASRYTGELIGAYVYDTVAECKQFIELCQSEGIGKNLSIHVANINPLAGFQTVNITQLNADGSRQDEEYRREQEDKVREFNTANPLT